MKFSVMYPPSIYVFLKSLDNKVSKSKLSPKMDTFVNSQYLDGRRPVLLSHRVPEI